MKHRIPIVMVLSVFAVLLLRCEVTASASGVPVSGSSEAALPANTGNNENTDTSASFLAQPRQAIVKVATVGTLASGTKIGGLLASVTYTASGYTIASGGVFPSGVAGGATTIFAANVETAGQVILALIDINGIRTGEFATLTFQVADGYLPNISDFSVTITASDIAAAKNATIPGIGVVIQSFTLR